MSIHARPRRRSIGWNYLGIAVVVAMVAAALGAAAAGYVEIELHPARVVAFGVVMAAITIYAVRSAARR